MEQEKVLRAVLSERQYQDAKWGTTTEHPHEVGGWILLLLNRVQIAMTKWSSSNGDREALEEIRKVAAIAVACGEQYGFSRRSAYLTGSVDLRGGFQKAKPVATPATTPPASAGMEREGR